jgi:hypothetical protein
MSNEMPVEGPDPRCYPLTLDQIMEVMSTEILEATAKLLVEAQHAMCGERTIAEIRQIDGMSLAFDLVRTSQRAIGAELVARREISPGDVDDALDQILGPGD